MFTSGLTICIMGLPQLRSIKYGLKYSVRASTSPAG
jgi:hypothetical protein